MAAAEGGSAAEVATVAGVLDGLESTTTGNTAAAWAGIAVAARELVLRAYREQWPQIVGVAKYADMATTVAGLVGSAVVPESNVAVIGSALNKVSESTQSEVQIAWQELGGNDPDVSMKDLVDRIAKQIGDSHQAVSVLGSDVFTARANDLGITPKVVQPDPPPRQQIEKVVSWAKTTPDPVESVKHATDRIVKQGFRDTIQDSAEASGAAWARVPQGGETCAFCLILAARGAVYASEKSAKYRADGHKYHAHCDCVPVLIRSKKDYPDGYDPDALYEMYSKARGHGDADIKRIAAAMRRMFPDDVSDGVVQKEDLGNGAQESVNRKNVPSRLSRPKVTPKSGMDDPNWIREQLVMMDDLPDTAWKSSQTDRLKARLKELSAV